MFLLKYKSITGLIYQNSIFNVPIGDVAYF